MAVGVFTSGVSSRVTVIDVLPTQACGLEPPKVSGLPPLATTNSNCVGTMALANFRQSSRLAAVAYLPKPSAPTPSARDQTSNQRSCTGERACSKAFRAVGGAVNPAMMAGNSANYGKVRLVQRESCNASNARVAASSSGTVSPPMVANSRLWATASDKPAKHKSPPTIAAVLSHRLTRAANGSARASGWTLLRAVTGALRGECHPQFAARPWT